MQASRPVKLREPQSKRLAVGGRHRAGEARASVAPEVLTPLAEAPVDPLAFFASTDVFRGLPEAVLQDVAGATQWLHALGGQVLFRQGDPGDAVYLVVSGRLLVFQEGQGGGERRLREIGRGGNVGELALLTDEPRSAGVRAVRDTVLARLSRASFETVLVRHPHAMLPLTRTLARWVRDPRRDSAASGAVVETIALVPLGLDVPLEGLATRLCKLLAERGATVHVDAAFAAQHLPKGAVDMDTHPLRSRLSGWLDELEARHRYVVYRGGADSPSWTQRCIRQADRIVFVAEARGNRDAARQLAAQLVGDANVGGVREDLVLLYADDAVPFGTAAWQAVRPVSTCHHVRVGTARDVARLARWLTGRSVGVVLSGGGARGFAHIGVLRALEEAHIPVDRVGGASMGAIVGALYAGGMSPAEMVEINRVWERDNPLRQVTLPAISLISERAGANLAEHVFGERRIEDLWLDYFCVTANLTRPRLSVHRAGPMARWVLASASIPGISPPVLDDDGELHVDGGLLDNLPADVMAELDGGPRIAIDVCPPMKLPVDDYAQASSPWLRLRVLGAALLPFTSAPRVPNIFNILYATALASSQSRSERFKDTVDLYLEPPVSDCGVFEFGALDRVVEIGYRYARQRIAAWDGAAALRTAAGEFAY